MLKLSGLKLNPSKMEVLYIDRMGIKKAFLKFYSKLYSKDYVELEKIQNYIENCKVKKLKEEERNLM